MLSNPIIQRMIIHGESGDMKFFYRSANRYLSSERSDFSHFVSHENSRKIVKMVNLGKEIENGKK